MRDFIPSALAFLMKGEHLIVKNFLVETARLQSREKMVDLFKLGQGVMPASFKVHHCNPTQKTESLLADFGETAIGRVAPVDSGLWWIILLRAYTKCTGDNSLAESPNCQRAMHLILRLCLSEGCDTSPALLCADGCSMIDRRMVGCPPQSSYFSFLIMFDSVSLLLFSYALLQSYIQLHPCKSPISFKIETARVHMIACQYFGCFPLWVL